MAIACGLFLGTLLLGMRTGDYLVTSGKRYRLLIADSEMTREKGLGGRKSLAQNQAMLFVFDQLGVRCIWMKDMHFTIDIIWLDGEKRVTHIERAVSPSTYPRTYCPSEPAKYVIEFSAGEVDRAAIRGQQKLSF